MQRMFKYLAQKTSFIIMVLAAVAGVAWDVYASNNLEVKFENYRGISISMYKQPTTADFDKLQRWGVNFIRLVVQGDPKHGNYDKLYVADGVAFNDQAFQKMDKIIAMAGDHQIAVNIDLHTFPGTLDGSIWRDFSYWKKLEKLWVFIANRYKDNTTVVSYELMNEPRLVKDEGSLMDRAAMRVGAWTFPDEWKNTTKDYFNLVEKLGQSINKIDDNKSVIVPVVGIWGRPSNFNWMRPLNINNVVYTFHMYSPYAFGDSGKHGRPIVEYSSAKSSSKIIKEMLPARLFADKHQAKIFVGEFGLLPVTEGRGAKEWMSDVIEAMEENGFTWAYWSYNWRSPEMTEQSDGGMVRREDTERLTMLKKYWALNENNYK